MPNPLEGLITRQDISNIAESEKLILDDEDRLSVLESMRSMDVQACPGSGKTTLIAAKLILLAEKWPFPSQPDGPQQQQGIEEPEEKGEAGSESVENYNKK